MHNFQVFLPTRKSQRWCLSHKIRNVLIGVFVSQSFFCAILSFWVIVDFVFNSALGTSEKSVRDFCKPDSDANQFRLVSSILTHVGSKSAAPVGYEASQQFFFLQISAAKSWIHYKGENTKSTISQKLWIAQKILMN